MANKAPRLGKARDDHENTDDTGVRKIDAHKYMTAIEIFKALDTSIRNKAGHPLKKNLKLELQDFVFSMWITSK